MTEERREELRSLFWSESNDPWSQEWRDGLNDEERREVDKWDQQYDTAEAAVLQKITAAQSPAGPFYGQIDFLGQHGLIGESLYYTDRNAYQTEIRENRETGRPISSREITRDEYIRGYLANASEEKVSDGYYILSETPTLAVGVNPFSPNEKYRVWSTTLSPWGTLDTKASLTDMDYRELADNGIDVEYIQSTMEQIDEVLYGDGVDSQIKTGEMIESDRRYEYHLHMLQEYMDSDYNLTSLDKINGLKAIGLLSSAELRQRMNAYGIKIDQFDIKQLTVLSDIVLNGLVVNQNDRVLVSGITDAEVREIADPNLSQEEMLKIRNRLIQDYWEKDLFIDAAGSTIFHSEVLERLKDRPKLEELLQPPAPVIAEADAPRPFTATAEQADPGSRHMNAPSQRMAVADNDPYMNYVNKMYDEVKPGMRQGEVESWWHAIEVLKNPLVKSHLEQLGIDITQLSMKQLKMISQLISNGIGEYASAASINDKELKALADPKLSEAQQLQLRDSIVKNKHARGEIPFIENPPIQEDEKQKKIDTSDPRHSPGRHLDKKRNFTRDQLERAKQVDLLSYISSRYEVERHGGKNYRMKEHPSLVIFPETNSWYWFSKKEGGNILDFLTKYEDKNLVEAVYELLGETFAPQNMYQKEQAPQEEQKPVVLPDKADTNKHVYAYLTKTRGLDPAIVNRCLNDGSIYEGVHVVKRPGKDLTFYNCVFVGNDAKGNPAWASQRSTNDKMTFRGDAEHSRKECAFRMEARESSNWVNVFEAPIDAMSYATLQKRGGKDYGLEHHISLGGLGDPALEQFLKTHPEVDTVNLCLDNDRPGREAAAAIARKLRDRGYTVLESCPEHKDYNDDLKAELAADNQPVIDLPEKAQDNRRVFAHLARDAAINSDLVNRYITQGLLYQSEQTVERDGQVKKYASSVFLGRDPDGNPDYAMRVSLYRSPENGYFKVEYKDPEAGGCISIPGENSSLLVFNNPISMMTQQSMMLEAGKENKNHYLCALTGLQGEVDQYVREHPQINEVKLMLDKTVGISRRTNQPVDYRELTAGKVKFSLKSRKIEVVTKYPQTLDLNMDYLKSKGLAKGNSPQKGQAKGKELER